MSFLGSYNCDKTPRPEQLGEERVYLAYASSSLFINQSSQDRNSSSMNQEAGSDAEVMAECCLFAYSTHLAQQKESQQHQFDVAPPAMEWALPS